MPKFHEQPFESRYFAMGDDSEGVFETVESGWIRFGLRRPPFNVGRLPLKLRYAPDYLQGHRLVEVQAMGHDGLLKVKVEKAEALHLWRAEFDLGLFIWDSGRKQYGCAPWRDLARELCLRGEGAVFERDGKAHWRLARDAIPVEGGWTPHEP